MSKRIQYKKGDLIGPYNCIFLYETEQDIQPCGKKNRRAQFLCPYCKEKEFNARIVEVNRGKTRSCGCYRVISKQQTHMKDIAGKRSGYLTAIKRLEEKAPDNSYLWLCQCDCGETTKLTTSEFERIKSCGCKKGFTQGENKVEEFLKKNFFNYLKQYSFKDCYGDSKKDLLRFDFYLPDYCCCIEIDGRQHREPVDRFGGIEQFIKQVRYDNIKNQYCLNYGIFLIRIPYDSKRKEYQITEERLQKIFKDSIGGI